MPLVSHIKWEVCVLHVPLNINWSWKTKEILIPQYNLTPNSHQSDFWLNSSQIQVINTNIFEIFHHAKLRAVKFKWNGPRGFSRVSGSGNFTFSMFLVIFRRLYNIAHRMRFKSIMDFPLYSNIEWYLLMFCRSPMIGESFSGES